MATLSQIVDVQITRESRVPSQRGFGTPLILGDSDRFTAGERIREYTDLAGVEADFTSGDVEIDIARDLLAQQVRPSSFKIGQVEAGDGAAPTKWSTALTAIEAIDDDWYGLILESKDQADIEEVAQNWVESRIKQFFALTADADVKNDVASNVLENLNAANIERTSVWFSEDVDNYLSAAIAGLQLPKDPGSTNWAYQTLSGPDFDDLTPTEQSNITDAKGNIYIRVAGLNITQFGTVAGGEFIDVIRGSDFLQARIQELVYAQLVQSEKIPFTNQGISLVENRLREALDLGVQNQIINEDYTITVPDVSAVSDLDKGNRFLPDVEFQATLTGAINKTQIRGRLVL